MTGSKNAQRRTMPPETTYDAFISYNQKHDKSFVKNLQHQLQRLGKPWWQRRAIRVFLDQSSLSAAPGLWSSIERSLSQSRYFILCASPDSSRSYWVNKEVAWWLANKGPETLLVALTEGSLEWNRKDNAFFWTDATPLPECLKGVFRAEPKWTDFRSYRSASDKRRKPDDTFISLIAEISATIRGVPKEDLLSEDLRQQRRALRAAYMGVVCLAVATAAASWLGYLAYRNGLETLAQRDIALLQQTQLITGLTENQDDGTALALLLEVLPDARSDNSVQSSRPFWGISNARLNAILDKIKETRIFGDGGSTSIAEGAFCANEPRLLLGKLNSSASILDGNSLAPVARLDAIRRFNDIAFNGDCSKIVFGLGTNFSSKGSIAEIWDAARGTKLFELRGHEGGVSSVDFSKDSTRVVTGSLDGTARIWDAATGALLFDLKEQDHIVDSVAFSPDGTQVITGTRGGTIYLWDAQTGKRLSTFSVLAVRTYKDRTNYEIPGVRSLGFSNDGTRIIAGFDDAIARIWNLKSGVELDAIEGRSGAVTSVAFGLQDKRIVTGSEDGTVRLWDVEPGIFGGHIEMTAFRGHVGRIKSARLSADGEVLLTTGVDNTVRFWTCKLRDFWPLSGYASVITAASFNPTGDKIVTASGDHWAIVWDAENGTELRRFEHVGVVHDAAFSPDGRKILTGSGRDGSPDNIARLWDASSGALLRWFETDESPAYYVSFSHDGTLVTVGAENGRVYLYNSETGALLERFGGHTGRIRTLEFSLNDTILVTSSFEDPTIRVWDTQSLKEIAKLAPKAGVNSVAVSPNGRLVLAGAGSSFDRDVKDTNGHLWDLVNQQEFLLTGHGSTVDAVAFSADGRSFATSSWDDRTVNIWNTSTMEVSTTLKGLKDRVSRIVFSPNGRYLLTSGSGTSAKLWDIKNGLEIGEINSRSKIDFAAFSPDGNTVLTGLDRIQLWSAKVGQELVDFAKQNAPRCLTPEQRKQFYLFPEVPSWCTKMNKWPYGTGLGAKRP